MNLSNLDLIVGYDNGVSCNLDFFYMYAWLIKGVKSGLGE